MSKKSSREDLKLPPLAASVEDIMKALLRTPPPPAGDPSTRKKKPAKKKTPRVRAKVTK